MVTTHHPRRFGKTKYGLSRTLRVVLDLLTVKYMLDYYSSPMKLFGRIGFNFLAVGGLMLAATIGAKLVAGTDMTGNPLLLLGAILCVVSVQLFSLGLLGEANTRLYYARNSRRPFTIRKTIRHPFGDHLHGDNVHGDRAHADREAGQPNVLPLRRAG
jgi:hypothetical protein